MALLALSSACATPATEGRRDAAALIRSLPAFPTATVRDVIVREITVRDEAVRDVAAREITAREITAREITAREITAREITARDVSPSVEVHPLAQDRSGLWQERLPQSRQGRPAHAAYPRGDRPSTSPAPLPEPHGGGGDWRRTPYRVRRGWSGFATLTLGPGGDYDFDDEALGADDSDATYVRLRAGALGNHGSGGGIDLQIFSPDDRFYENNRNETSADHFDVFLHLLAHPLAGQFRMPVRIGPYLSMISARFESTGDYTDYISIGARFEAQPEIVLFEDDDWNEISLFGRISGGVHGTSIRDQSTDATYDSNGTTLGLEAGVRFTFGHASLAASYLFHQNTTRESDERDFGSDVLAIPRLETEFDGFLITLGVSF